MKECYIDTSVLGAYYTPEPLSEKAQAFLRRTELPVISMLTEVELCSLVAKKIRVGDFGTIQGRRIINEFRRHLGEGYFRIIEPEQKHYARAVEMLAAFKTPLRSLDALHLAIVMAENLPVVTADATFARAARYFGATVKILRT